MKSETAFKRSASRITALAALMLAFFAAGCAPKPNIDPALISTKAPRGRETQTETAVPETTVPETTVPETTEPETTEPATTEPETTEPETPAVMKRIRDTKRLWVGDSRVLGLKDHTYWDQNRDEFIYKVGERYNWFINSAVPELRAKLAEDPFRSVLICMGVNDTFDSYRNPEKFKGELYAKAINELIDEYPYTKFYFYAIGPNKGQYAYVNSEIDHYNEVIEEKCRAKFIDVASVMKEKGYGMYDGLHYIDATYTLIYNFVLDQYQ